MSKKIENQYSAALDDCCLVSDEEEDENDGDGDADDDIYYSSGNEDTDEQAVIYSF
ncbi:hypothetical protein PI125_g10508 [Phytophthora idaei]|nr:hypothetical protein PI125_g10508 [Phytophthora idaei]KAG3153734.1 hypothetical protein PI126_g9938 [Phytophthora idaei]